MRSTAELRERLESLLTRYSQGYEEGDSSGFPSTKDTIDAILALVQPRPALFQLGDFTLHSGKKAKFKIECDALEGSWEALAWLMSERVKFSSVSGVPTGGTELANQLQKYCSTGPHLVVDDVLTTGGSILEEMNKYPGSSGYVVFARGPLPHGVQALFVQPRPIDAEVEKRLAQAERDLVNCDGTQWWCVEYGKWLISLVRNKGGSNG